MAIGVVFIWRFSGDFESEPDDGGACDIDEAFDSICDEGVGIAEDSRREFDADEEEIDDETGKGDLARFGGLDFREAGGWSCGRHGE